MPVSRKFSKSLEGGSWIGDREEGEGFAGGRVNGTGIGVPVGAASKGS